jgi:ferredoxin
MKATVDPDLCIGCGLCEETCPEVFRLGDDSIAHVIDDDPPAETYADIEEAAELCPTSAITVSGS